MADLLLYKYRVLKLPQVLYLLALQTFKGREERCRENNESKSQIIRELIVFGFNYKVDYDRLTAVSHELNAIGKNINQIAATPLSLVWSLILYRSTGGFSIVKVHRVDCYLP